MGLNFYWLKPWDKDYGIDSLVYESNFPNPIYNNIYTAQHG